MSTLPGEGTLRGEIPDGGGAGQGIGAIIAAHLTVPGGRPSAPAPGSVTWPPGGLRLLFLFLLLAAPALALKPTDRFTLRDLEQAPGLTPGKFADLFEDFAYEFSAPVLPPDDFLAQRSGDCDDYACLAAFVLRQKGYHPRLVQVQLVGTNVDHAVCYISEQKVYLDYNNRKYTFNLEKSRPTVRDIANAVADSLEQNWTTAFEFTFSYADPRKRITWVIVKTDPPDHDPDRQPAARKTAPP